ncbi:peptidase S8 [Mesorhizobium sp. YM1C-6-2]|nr:peptidase S8 [Mesorhizobium sp. YM1C-6-2]
MADKAVPGKVGSGFPSGIASRHLIRTARRLSIPASVLAAVLLAAFPASAQTNDPNLTEQDLDCFRKQAEGGPDCVPGQAPEESAPDQTEPEKAEPEPQQPTRESGAEPDAEQTTGEDAKPEAAPASEESAAEPGSGQAGEAAPQPDEFTVQGQPSKPDSGAAVSEPAAAAEPDAAGPGRDAGSDTATDSTGASTGSAENADPNAVLLPGLIVDLFPNPPPAAAPEPAVPAQADAAIPAAPPPADPPAPPAIAPGALAAVPPVAAPVAVQGEFVPDEVLVTVDGDAAVAAAVAQDFGLEVRSQRTSTLLDSTIVRYGIPDGRPVGVVLAQLAGDGRTTRRVPNHVYDLQQAAGIVNYAFQRIALAPDTANGENVGVAVIDTALDETHPAIKDAIAGEFDAMPGVEVTTRDHATSVAGLIAGTGEFRGMAPGARIFHARAFEGGKSTMDVILSALDWAAGEEVRIVNMSFVGPKNDLLEEACAAARERDIVLVAAAGNNGPNAPYGYPAAYPGVIAVTATDDKDELMAEANRGPYVFVSAPGVNVIAPVGGGQDLVTGTSFAAAVVSGAIANLIHAAPDRSADWIEAALSSTAKDLGEAGRDSDFGFGLIDAKAAGEMQDD